MSAFKASREIPAPAEQVFAAFSDPERLARRMEHVLRPANEQNLDRLAVKVLR